MQKKKTETQLPVQVTPSTNPNKIRPEAELGVTGLKRFGGYVYEEFLPELAGKKAIEKYREMGDNDSICAALLFALQMLARGVEWYVQPGGDTSQDQEAADFLDSNLNGMESPWHEFITEVVHSECRYGHSPHEIIYRQAEEGSICWHKLPIRAPITILRWEFEDNGDIKGLWQLAPPFYRLTYIPAEKFLLFRTVSSKNNPEGKSILRTSYRAYTFKKNLEEIEAIGAERGVAGIPVAWVPPQIASPDSNSSAAMAARQTYIDLTTNIRRDSQEGIVFPLAYDEAGRKLYDLTLLTTQGHESLNIGNIIKRKSVEILQSCLAEFIMLGTQNVGSWALAKNKSDIFMKALDAFLDGIEEVLNSVAVSRLFALNPRFRVEKYPQIKHAPVQDVDLDKLGTLILALTQAGCQLFPDDELENFIRDAAGLPTKIVEQAETIQKAKKDPAQKRLRQKGSIALSVLQEYYPEYFESKPEKPKGT